MPRGAEGGQAQAQGGRRGRRSSATLTVTRCRPSLHDRGRAQRGTRPVSVTAGPWVLGVDELVLQLLSGMEGA